MNPERCGPSNGDAVAIAVLRGRQLLLGLGTASAAPTTANATAAPATGDLTAPPAPPPDGSPQPLEWRPDGAHREQLPRAQATSGVPATASPSPDAGGSTSAAPTHRATSGCTCASLASANLTQTSPALDCTTAIDAVAAPPARGDLDAVAPPDPLVAANPSGDSSSDRRLFAETGLLVRSGATADLVIPLSDQSVATMGWGSPGIPVKVVHVAGCTSSDPWKPWLAFAGWLLRPEPGLHLTRRGGRRGAGGCPDRHRRGVRRPGPRPRARGLSRSLRKAAAEQRGWAERSLHRG